ncbi:MAG: [cytidine(C)-cytidine(C)-adenosine (A)]-adding enzyme [Deltaproteobacteria bacterium]|nr:[cytidine(C)-cytidine(C)-adenosine (A)]-adding enzyme [Deltaproteobacteria bacterium]
MATPLPPRLSHAQIPEYVTRVVRALDEAGHPSFLVGGCARDLLRGVQPKDFDVATRARPEVVLKLFPKTVPTGLQHGTVTVVEPEGHVEVTTFRGEEGYQDGRRPDRVVFLDDVESDLSRRDFTINAIAFDPHRQLMVDPFGGVKDLERELIRCVGKADDRFGEDGLRPLRAVRFASVLRFELEPETLAAIPRALNTYARVAIERVADELRKLLHGPRPSRGLQLLMDTGLWIRILPALKDESKDALAHRFARVNFTPRTHAHRLAALFWDHPKALEALKPSTELLKRVQEIDRHHTPMSTSKTDPELRRFASQVGRARLHDVLVLQRAELRTRGDAEACRTFVANRARLHELLASNPPLTAQELALRGDALASLVGGPGPEVGRAQRRLLDAVLDDPTANTPERLRELLSPGRH